MDPDPSDAPFCVLPTVQITAVGEPSCCVALNCTWPVVATVAEDEEIAKPPPLLLLAGKVPHPTAIISSGANAAKDRDLREANIREEERGLKSIRQ